MPVDSKHPDFADVEKDYTLIGDCIAGQRAIKKAGEKYLPKPNPEDTSDENLARYKAYKTRAVFHNATARTVGNMVGQSFAVDPVATMPDQMKPWLEDIDGAGVSATQQSKKALGFVVAFSRAFLWVDYPKTDGVTSIQDAEEKGIRPRIILCDPRKVINWRFTPHGAKSKLSLVVIAEPYVKKDDGFMAELATQYRVLRLLGETYWVEVYRPGSGANWVLVERLQPLGGDGQPLDYIPGLFIGAETNDTQVEKPQMLDIANLNVAHYRNSADYEEMTYMVGQPTPWVSGLTNDWIERHLKGQIMLGSRAIIPLPENASAGLLQAQAETLPKEAMDQKEALMTALGAKLVEKREVQQTATETGVNQASETSILATCCKNVSAGYTQGFKWAAMFANITLPQGEEVKPAEGEEDAQATGNQDAVLYELNTDFAMARMTPEEAQAAMALEQGGMITWEEGRDKLKSGGWAYLDDETAKDQIAKREEEAFAKAQAELKAQTDETIRANAAKPKPGAQPPAAA